MLVTFLHKNLLQKNFFGVGKIFESEFLQIQRPPLSLGIMNIPVINNLILKFLQHYE